MPQMHFYSHFKTFYHENTIFRPQYFHHTLPVCYRLRPAIQNGEAGATEANWSTETKVLAVSYKGADNKKIQQAIANAGYDTQDFTAPDAVYEKLHECCKYDRKNAAPKTAAAAEKCCDGKDCCKDGKCTMGKDCCKAGSDCCKDGKCVKGGSCCKDGKAMASCCKDGKCEKCAKGEMADCCKDGKSCKETGCCKA